MAQRVPTVNSHALRTDELPQYISIWFRAR